MNRIFRDRLGVFIGLMLSVLLMIGCNIFDDKKDKVVEITPEFYMDLFEELGQPRQFQLIASSLADQDCANYSIDVHSQQTGTNIRISISDIVRPENCIAGNAPAKSVITVGFLNAGRNYNFQINLKNTIFNNGILSVSDRAYVLSMESTDGLELIRSELLRIPPNIIWGYVGYDDAEAAAEAPENFIINLESLTDPADFEEGYYGHFSVDGNNKISFPNPLEFQHLKTFIYPYDGAELDLENLLRTFREGPAGDVMEIRLFNSEGKVF